MATEDQHDLVDAALARLPELAPPPGFADRVLAGMPSSSSSSSSRWSRWRLGAGAVTALAASVALVVGLAGPSSAPSAGTVASVDRVTVATPAATIVAEAGARLSWQGADVRLEGGDVFVRADRPLTIHTPAGDVDVTGTCFRVSVTPASGEAMPTAAHIRPLTAGVVGAVAGAAVILGITVFEGSVHLHNDHGSVSLAAGQSGTATSTTSPTGADTVPVAAARQARARALAQQTARALEATASTDVDELVAENTRLRTLVARQDEELALSDIDRIDREGVPLPFPKDLPARLTEKGLVNAFTSAFADTGVVGAVTAVDCAEYPCIVWGEMTGDTAEMMAQLKASPTFQSLYENDSTHVRGWGSGDGKPELFAVTLLQKGENAPDEKAVNKRVRQRTESNFEANKPASWATDGDAGTSP